MLDGGDPFPDPRWTRSPAPNLIWPPLAAYLVAPLTLLPPGAADVVMAILGLAALALSLWLVGVRDGAFTARSASGPKSPARCGWRT